MLIGYVTVKFGAARADPEIVMGGFRLVARPRPWLRSRQLLKGPRFAMPAPPRRSTPSPSPAEMQTLLAPTGLVLNPGQMADLVLAWRQVAAQIASIPRGRPMGDDQAYVFRLPAPLPAQRAAPARKKAPVRKKPARKPARARR
ncbi:MAG: hypothetical protein ABI369_08465 [Acetobacteraceae bacterium]